MIQAVILGATAIICIGVIYTLVNRNKAAANTAQGYSRGPPPRSPTPSYSDGQVRNRRTKRLAEIECVICLENPPQVETYPCRHQILCEPCILRLISECKRSCPVCRRDIKGYNNI